MARLLSESGTIGGVATQTELDARVSAATTAAQGVGTGNEVTHSKLTATNGVLFGTDTAAANTLDDYEEGTWTGVLSDGTNAMSMNGSYTTGYYTKVGNLVTVSGYFITSSLGSASGTVRITGLPFTIANHQAAYAGGVGLYSQGLAITAGYTVTYFGAVDSTYVVLMIWDTTLGTTALTTGEWTSDGQIKMSFTYRVA